MNKGYIYAIVAAVLFGTAGMFVKLAQRTGLDSITLLTLQYVFAVILMFTIGFIKNKQELIVTKNQLKHLAILGIVGNTFMTVFYYMAFEYLPVAMVTMLLFTYPIMIFIYSYFFERTKLNFKKRLAIFIAFIGCICTLNIIGGGFSYSIKGIIYGLLSAVFYAFMNLYSEKKLENVEALAINAYSTAFSLLILCVFKFPVIVFQGKIKIESICYIAVIAIFCEIIPLTLLYASIKYIGSLKVSIINNLEIPIAILGSYLVLSEKVTFIQLVGAMLIVYAIYLIREKS